ncbi:hypothetical protein [Herpetosiphon giganteus]|uniref:hypothetical protein n=1 Tax=Herpetosiphon giganteus TaxID=2029754 RepID=UPI00195B2FB9|nr:hypothetical protein [Herpetosiphon giganteus]MBM7842878.1 hypothetical protein [Herpetosiphon giganteus]
MRRRIRWLLLIGGVVGLSVAIGIGWWQRAAPAVKPNRTLVQDQTGNLQLITASKPALTLTNDASASIQYTQVTPAPDGQHVAYIQLSPKQSEIRIQDFDGSPARSIFSDFNLRPFYLAWSPDSQSIAFLAAGTTMELYVVPANGSQTAHKVRDGQPSYFAWKPDSSALLLHTGGGTPVGSTALHSLQSNDLTFFSEIAGDFQAPAWNADGSARVVVVADGNINQLMQIDQTGQRALSEPTSDGFMFVLSPDRSKVAYQTFGIQTRSGLMIQTIATGKSQTFETARPLAFFWSPDGRSVALLVADAKPRGPSGDTGIVQVSRQAQTGVQVHWEVLDVKSGSVKRLKSFAPSSQFLNVLPYFDQYAASLTFWSSDSQYLLNNSSNGVWQIHVETGAEQQLTSGAFGVAVP